MMCCRWPRPGKRAGNGGKRDRRDVNLSGWKLSDDDGGEFSISGNLEPGAAITSGGPLFPRLELEE